VRISKLTTDDLNDIANELRHGYLTFRDLGKKYGVSGQRVQQINENRFKVNARAREASRTKARHLAIENQLKIHHYSGPVQAFARRAIRCGLTVLPLVTYASRDGSISNIATSALNINGKLCSLHVSTAKPNCKYVRKFGELTSYYSFHFRQDTRWRRPFNPKFYILIVGHSKRYFIIPQVSLNKNRRVYIPAHARNNYNNRKPKTEYLIFENRFDLLGGKRNGKDPMP
jgi:hypothetical protein